MRDPWKLHSAMVDRVREMQAQIDRLTAERDEARREVCQKHDHGYFTDEDYAEIRGWDCFKEAR